MDGTIIGQGTFVGTGANILIDFRAGVDWMRVYNYSNIANAAPAAPSNCEAFWQLGMVAGSGVSIFKTDAGPGDNTIYYDTYTTTGFYPFDSSASPLGAPVAVTGITNAAPPVVDTGNTGVLANGDMVRLINIVGGQQLGGIDFTVGNVIANTSFTLANMPAIVAAAGGGTSEYIQVKYDPLFYPRRRTIASITQAVAAEVTTTVNHGYQVGQLVSFRVPSSVNGMVQMNNLYGTILVIDSASTFTVDINTTNFTAFTFALTAQVPYTPAEVVPVGEDTALALAAGVNILSDATVNTGVIGMILTGGAGNPGGANGDVLFWMAGKSTLGGQ